MTLLQRLFGRKEDAIALPPLVDPSLGELCWNGDSEGWVGAVTGPTGTVQLYLGGGSAQAYPSEQFRDLMHEPYARFHELAETARAYLRQNINATDWGIDLGAFVVVGLESYEHHLKSGAYTITFKNGDSEAVWRVNFESGSPIGCGVDD